MKKIEAWRRRIRWWNSIELPGFMNWWVHSRFMKWNVKRRVFRNTHLRRALLNRNIYKLICIRLFRTVVYSHYFKFCNFFKTQICCEFLRTATFALFFLPNSLMLFNVAFNKNCNKCRATDTIFSTNGVSQFWTPSN